MSWTLSAIWSDPAVLDERRPGCDDAYDVDQRVIDELGDAQAHQLAPATPRSCRLLHFRLRGDVSAWRSLPGSGAVV
jgi:hypothetical protein